MIETPEKSKMMSLLSHWHGEFFYLPILRCIRATKASTRLELLEDVSKIRANSPFYSYETDQRWYNTHQSEISLEQAIIYDKWTALPVSTNGKIKVYCYGQYSSEAIALIHHKFNNAAVIWYSYPEQKLAVEPSHNIYFQEFQKNRKINTDILISDFNNLSNNTKKSFVNLTGSETEWVPSLFNDLESGKIKSPVFCTAIKDQVVGILGPLDIYSDIENNRFLAPTYFAVDDRFRRKGIGHALRHAMENYVFSAGAKYKILQAEYGSPADMFYRAEGLKVVGQLYNIV